MNNSSQNRSFDYCEDAKIIVGTNQLFVVLILECVFGFAAVFPNALTIYLFWRAKVFHPNLRLLLANLSFDLALYSATIGEKSLRRLLTPVCDLPMMLKSCIVQEWATSIPLHNALLSLVVLGLERIYVTIRYRTYDFAKTTPYLAMFLLACAWTSTLSVQFASYKSIPVDFLVSVCEAPLLLSPQQMTSVYTSFVVLEAVAASLSIFIYVYNRFILSRMVINRAKYDLSSRFQVDQNVKLNQALLPSDALHIVCYLPNYIFLLLTISHISLHSSTKMWVMHSTFLYRLIYASAHPILLITRNVNLRQGLFKSVFGRAFAWFWRQSCHCKRGQATKVQDLNLTTRYATDTHFDQLERAWANAKQ